MAVLAVCGLGGCIDQGLTPTPWGYNGADFPPEIEVIPDRLDYGELGPHEEKILSFVVRNVAESPYAHLNVSEVALTVPTGFTFVTNNTAEAEPISDSISFDLGQGMEETLYVRFAPDSPITYEAMAKVHSNDEGHGMVPVTLKGKGLIPKLDISPNPYNFGEVTVGCEQEGKFTLTNVGNAPLTVSSLTEEANGMTLLDDVTPLVLDPGGMREVTMRFTPSEGIAYGGDLIALSDDPEQEHRAVTLGDGYVPALHREIWELEVDPLVDVLFVVDRSISMEDDHDALAENFEDFIWEIDDYTPNWRIGVAMPDNGCLHDGVYIDEDVRDYRDIFNEGVTEDAEEGMLYTEAGLIVASRAVAETDGGECNDGFLREDALLHVILVADEPEQSPYAWDRYVEDIVAKKGERTKVKISAVAGDYPWGCVTDENSAEAGTGYYEATRATYGRWLSLCDSWYENANELAQATVRQDTFPLARWPDPATVKVFRNGDPAEFWHYDPYLNAVVFDEHKEPHEGWTIEVEYHDPYTCD